MREAEIQRILRGRDVAVIEREWVYADWVKSLAPWDTYFTNTFRWPASVDSARRLWERWIKKYQPGVPVFYGIDPNPSGDGGHHVHSLLASGGGCYRKEAWDLWWHRYGVNRVVPVTSIEGGLSGYCAKYPLSGSRWWNVLNCVQRRINFGSSRASRLSAAGVAP